MPFHVAERKSLPVLISLAGRSGSGKTYSALQLAKGLVGDEGDIYMIDTERGRGSMYADDPETPRYLVDELYPDFTPARFVEKIREAEKAGAKCIIIDSMSHEWSGTGGVVEMADNQRTGSGKSLVGLAKWNRPKLEHKKMMNVLTQLSCHVICCLRADHKTISTTDSKGKTIITETPDLIPEQEKRFVYEMTLSATIDEKNHIATFTKLPKPLVGSLDNRVINKDTGTIIREWVSGGVKVSAETERLKAEMRQLAQEQGTVAMRDKWSNLTKEEREEIKPYADEFKSIGMATDERIARESSEENDPFADQESVA